jgi:hypothetical protein
MHRLGSITTKKVYLQVNKETKEVPMFSMTKVVKEQFKSVYLIFRLSLFALKIKKIVII